MNEVKHTPGPWEAEPMTGRGAWVKSENGTWAALSCGDTDLEAEANARLIAAAPKLKDALAAMLDFWGGHECPEVDAAIAVMQEIGEDRWSMQAQMDAAKAKGLTP